MIYKMVWITCQFEKTIQRIESLEKPSFEFMQKLVGGYVTQTIATFEGEEVWILVDEDGIGKGLSLNHMASSYADQELVGDALILVNFELD